MTVAPLKVLAFDNQPLMLWALKRAGKVRDIDIVTAVTADDALAELSGDYFDLFLVDYDPENDNHRKLLKTIDDWRPYVPVIIMTTADIQGGAFHETVREVRKNGAWHLLEKPFSLDHVISFIEMIFQGTANTKLEFADLNHNFDNERRYHMRRAHVLPISFSFKLIMDGEQKQINESAILTDISDCGIGLLSNRPLDQSQVISFELESKTQHGIVAWSQMIGKETCRAGIHLC